MSHTVKSQPFDLRIGDDVTIVTPGDEKNVTGVVTMAAAPIYEVRLEEGIDLAVGAPIRCEPKDCPRQSRVLASVVGNKKGETRIWITAMEIKVGQERAKRYAANNLKAEVTPEVGLVALKDVSTSGLSFLSSVRVYPGDLLTVEVLGHTSPVKVGVEVMHITQEVGVPDVIAGCRLANKSDAWADLVKTVQASLIKKAS